MVLVVTPSKFADDSLSNREELNTYFIDIYKMTDLRSFHHSWQAVRFARFEGAEEKHS